MFKAIFKPGKIAKLEIKNRLVVSAMLSGLKCIPGVWADEIKKAS